MKRFSSVFLFSLFVCVFVITGYSPSWPFQLPVTVTLLPPAPGHLFIEDLWRIQLDNPTSETYQAYLYMEISEAYAGLIARAETGVFTVPPGLKILSADEMSPIDADFFNPEYETIVEQAGSFPAGSYTVLLILYDAGGNPIGEGEFFFTSENPSPPELIMPLDLESIIDSYMTVFSWLPPVPAGIGNWTYSLRIVEILEGQNTTQAMQSNPRWYEIEDMMQIMLPYPITAEEFEIESQYAWQVEAFNSSGVSIGSSEIRTFSCSGGSDLFESEPGEEKWHFQCSDVISCSPAIGDDWSIVFGCRDGNVFAIGPNGVERWRYNTGGPVSGISMAQDGTVFAAGTFGICCINPLGSALWSNRDLGAICGTPSVSSDDHIYAGGETGIISAIDAADGEVIWFFDAESSVHTGITIGSNGMIFLGSTDKKLYALSASDGTEEWSFGADGKFESPISIGKNGTVYAGTTNGTLYALNPDSGEPLWGFSINAEITSGAAIAFGGVIHIGASDGNLYLIDENTGREIRRFRTNGVILSTPAIGGMGTFFFGSCDMKMYAVSPVGTESWNFDTEGMIRSSPAIGVDGTVYFGSDDMKFYALSSSESGLAFSPWPKFNSDNRNSANGEMWGGNR